MKEATGVELSPLKGEREPTSRFWAYLPVGRTGGLIIAAVVIVIVVIDVAATIAGVSDAPLSTTIVQSVLTLAFLLFVWRPPTAALVLQVGTMIAVLLDGSDSSLLAVAVGAGLVVATCSRALTVVYLLGLGGLVLAADRVAEGPFAIGTFVVIVVFALVSTLVGTVLRRMWHRTAQLASDLEEGRRMLERAVQAERDRIADELHDFIAHELTIIAMHARVLGQSSDDDVQRQSRDAIDSSARQALADIRRVLELTQATRVSEDEPMVDTHPDSDRRRLLPTLADVERELRAAGAKVEFEGAYENAPLMSRSMDMAMAQFLREAATNIVKHAAPSGLVSISFVATDDDVEMSIRNAVDGDGSLTLPRGGYGIVRMKERASVLGGSFSAGPTEQGWLVKVQLPSR